MRTDDSARRQPSVDEESGDSLKRYFDDKEMEKRLRPAVAAQVFSSEWKARE